jgi:hypothetical protein
MNVKKKTKIYTYNGWCLDVEMFEVREGEDPVEALIRGIERKVGSGIFTWKILNETKEKLKTVIIFEDRRVLYGDIIADLTTQKGTLGLRIQADFI